MKGITVRFLKLLTIFGGSYKFLQEITGEGSNSPTPPGFLKGKSFLCGVKPNIGTQKWDHTNTNYYKILDYRCERFRWSYLAYFIVFSVNFNFNFFFLLSEIWHLIQENPLKSRRIKKLQNTPLNRPILPFHQFIMLLKLECVVNLFILFSFFAFLFSRKG